MKDKHSVEESGEFDVADTGSSQGQPLIPSFSGVVLVCSDCEDRGNGPRKLCSKDVRKQLKDGLRPVKGQLRVAVTTCLGPCPKRAMTVAVVAGGKVTMRAIDHLRQVDALGAEAVAIVEGAALQSA